ncbi:hypothetical protein JOJ86_006031 [Rhodococcus percolatus]|uniref:hypothetical protein n=1 Tax=Rhodococcus opacus TaxID=37919 RepID=UPI0015FA7A35|nr:hypothetical protein [Rhodococcus opacus]MBA8964753.1 hypothetical protein [Rhodococcus opacus]MBP2208305.1 hypothetical protein [Rhodococcus opacus]
MTTSASEHLANLEAAAVAGKRITATDLAAAQAAVRIEELAAEGARIREAEEKAKTADERRATAKAEAAALLEGHGTDEIINLWVAAVDAQENLIAGITAYNEVISTAGRILDRGGVPPQLDRNSEPLEHFDADNTFGIVHGQIKSVRVEGESHNTLEGAEGVLVGHAVQDVARRHKGLPLPFSKSIENRLNLGSFGAGDAILTPARNIIAERAAA